jgi:ATP-dependent RNA helicase DeaD
LITFQQLGLSNEILQALADLGFTNPTEIQEQAISSLLTDNRDFIGLANTGTGKTAAFGIPLLERMETDDKFTQALVLAPTRELGQQIAGQLNLFARYMGKINILPVYGGAAISVQIQALRKTQQIIIATPGRLIDLIGRKAVKLDQLRFLVLDEADEMLNMGFKEDIDKILSFTPKEKLTWLFSATMPPEIRKIVKKYMDNPVEVKVNADTKVNANIEHQFAVVKQADKPEALMRFLDIHQDMRGLIFCRTKRDTQNLAEMLLNKNYKVDALHGDLSQPQRDRVMRRFKTHELQILIATDVAARGIDVDDLTHVFHYTLPDDHSYYTHRSGRTARAGKKGISIAFANTREKSKIERLEKKLNISFKKVLIPSSDEIADIRLENWCRKILEKKANGRIHPQMLAKAELILGNLSKEELVAKLLVNELDKLNPSTSGNLNTQHPEKSSGKSRENRKERYPKGKKDRKSIDYSLPGKTKSRSSSFKSESSTGSPRFFINLGSRDRMNKHDLMDFICRHANVRPSDIGHVDLQGSHSFFEVDARVSRKFPVILKTLS